MKNFYKISDQYLDAKIKKDFGEANGTYILHWYSNDTPKDITRLLGIDCNGILYIGKTDKTLYYRVGSLVKAIKSNHVHSQEEPRERGHKALSKKFFRIRKHISIDDLYVEVKHLIESPEKDESRLLEEYAAKYGELPPLNGNYGTHTDWTIF